jgi:murein L,D-transpeptidase YafK
MRVLWGETTTMNPVPHFLVPIIFGIISACQSHMSPETKMPEERVIAAELELGEQIHSNLRARNLKAGDSVFIRAFKEEKLLEVWMKAANSDTFIFYRDFEICAASGKPGRKLKQGDYQVPEGFYHIDRFNPLSNFHLSLGINYPNDADRFFADKETPGGDIFIHGSCQSIGCLAMTDEYIKEIYLLCDWARMAGQEKIEVHIFPFKMNEEGIRSKASSTEQMVHWTNIFPGFGSFENSHQLPLIKINAAGRYAFDI